MIITPSLLNTFSRLPAQLPCSMSEACLLEQAGARLPLALGSRLLHLRVWSFLTIASSPLDVAKVAMQLRGEGGGTSKSSRSGVFRTMQHIVARDGVRGLWKASRPSISLFYNAVRSYLQ
jgi:hypothetical protein